MRVCFTFPARIIDAVSGAESPALKSLPSFKATDVDLDNYLDAEVADCGVLGGEVHVNLENGLPTLDVVYWCPDVPTNQLIESLRTYTIAQLEDGIGEGGFEREINGKRRLIVADTEESGSVEVSDDGRHILGPPRIAIAARDRDLSRLATAIEADPQAIDRLHQGCTALHLAILFGQMEAIRQLLAAGANPNLIDAQGVTPLEACALSNALDDEQSRDTAQLLLDAGGNPNHSAPNGESAKSYAESRGKKMLTAIL